MYDACVAANVPTDAGMVAGYVDGVCTWAGADWDRFPNAIKVPISSIGTNAGTVLDVEPGNLNAKQAVAWVKMRRAAGVDPTIYTAEWAPGYTWADCIKEFDAAGEAQPHYWVAPASAFKDIPIGTIPVGAVAVQYDYPGPYDLNNVLDYWPGVDNNEVSDMTPDQDKMLQNVNDIVPLVGRMHQTVQGGLLPILDGLSKLTPATIAAEVVKELITYPPAPVNITASDISIICDGVVSRLKAQWAK